MDTLNPIGRFSYFYVNAYAHFLYMWLADLHCVSFERFFFRDKSQSKQMYIWHDGNHLLTQIVATHFFLDYLM